MIDTYNVRVRRADCLKSHEFTITGDTYTRLAHDPRFVILAVEAVEPNVTDWEFFLTWRDARG